MAEPQNEDIGDLIEYLVRELAINDWKRGELQLCSLVPFFCCHSALLAGVCGASSDSLHCMRQLDHEMAFSVHLQSGVEYTRAASCFPSRFGVARYSSGAPSWPCLCHASP